MTLKIKDPGSALTHFIAMILALCAASPLLIKAAQEPGSSHVLALTVFITSMILLYAASTIYHTLDISPKINRMLRKADHMMIFILIAGTYTPVMLLAVGGSLGIAILAAVWMIGLAGIVIKCFSRHRFGRWSLILYLAMGWLGIIAVRQMFAGMGALSFGLLLAGGVVYSLGAFFYASGRPYCHAAWHLFVLGGSTLHYFAVLLLP